ncbi:MAG TPA: hypothetical protein VGS57_01090 [Thermoanaerobaculia bacterium]|jgi:hypothetical protein|nr:hypothetical protein [Thermoanaerobaculia bacterium]
MSNRRSDLQKEVIEQLVAAKAVDFEAVGSVLSKYGARAAVAGDAISAVVHWRMVDICIPPEPYQRALEIERSLGGRTNG